MWTPQRVRLEKLSELRRRPLLSKGPEQYVHRGRDAFASAATATVLVVIAKNVPVSAPTPPPFIQSAACQDSRRVDSQARHAPLLRMALSITFDRSSGGQMLRFRTS